MTILNNSNEGYRIQQKKMKHIIVLYKKYVIRKDLLKVMLKCHLREVSIF